MKIAVLGGSGSGKSTLARALGQRYGVPVLHLDCVHWLPGWQERPREETRAIVQAFLDTHGGWVVDGFYRRQLFARRMVEADRIIMLEFNRFFCFFRAFQRFLQYHGRERFSMTEGCPEKFDWEFAKWILWESRSPQARVWGNVLRKKFPEKLTVVRNQKELDALYQAEGL